MVTKYLTQLELDIKIGPKDSSVQVQDKGYLISSEDSAFGVIYLKRIRFLQDVLINQIQSEHETVCSILNKFNNNIFEMDDFNSFCEENTGETVNRCRMLIDSINKNYVSIPSMGYEFWNNLGDGRQSFPKPKNEVIFFDKDANAIVVNFSFEAKIFQPLKTQLETSALFLENTKVFDTIIKTDDEVFGIKGVISKNELNAKSVIRQYSKIENYVGVDTLFFKPQEIKLTTAEINNINEDAETADAFTISPNPFLGSRTPAQKISKSFYGPDTKSNAIREVLYSFTKAFVEGRGRSLIWSSGYRTDSKNHENRGAFDYRSNNGLSSEERHMEARELSKALYENGYTNSIVITEEALLPSANTNGYHLLITGPTIALTSYINGKSISVQFKPQKGSENVTHTHVGIQPYVSVESTFKDWKLTEVKGSAERIQSLAAPVYFASLDIPFSKVLNMNFKPITEQQMAAILIRAIAYGSALQYSIQNGTYSGGPTYGFGSGTMGGGAALGGGSGLGGGTGFGSGGVCTVDICVGAPRIAN